MFVRVFVNGRIYESDHTDLGRYLEPPNLSKLISEEGIFLLPDGEPMNEVANRRMRAVFNREDPFDGVTDRYLDDLELGLFPDHSRDVIPGLWRWGDIPLLVGPYKAGKSTFGVELVTALVTPGMRFLDHFDATELPMDAHVWYINAENPIESFMEALFTTDAYGADYLPRRALHVEHMEALGHAALFDLTVPAHFDWWATHLAKCLDCENTGEFQVPTVVIADGVTAFLRGDTSKYAAWYDRFRELLRYLDIPNGLAIAHSTYRGDHPMGGTEAGAGADGIWLLNVNESRTRWMFSTQPRLGGARVDPIRVVMQDGRLSAASKATSAVDPATDSKPNSVRAQAPVPVSELVLAWVAAQNALSDEPKLDDIRRGVRGDTTKVDAAVRLLVEEGRLVLREKAVRGGVSKLYRIGQSPEEPIEGGNESK